jgi:hypothetical protein
MWRLEIMRCYSPSPRHSEVWYLLVCLMFLLGLLYAKKNMIPYTENSILFNLWLCNKQKKTFVGLHWKCKKFWILGYFRESQLRWKLYSTSASNVVVNFLKPNGHYMYHQFHIQRLCTPPIQCIYCLFFLRTEWLFVYRALRHWFNKRGVVSLLRGTNWRFMYFQRYLGHYVVNLLFIFSYRSDIWYYGFSHKFVWVLVEWKL